VPPRLSSSFVRRAIRRAPLLFLAGAVVGTLGDKAHTYFGVVRYPAPFVWGEAWWVPFLMGSAGCLFVETHALLAAFLRETPAPANRWRLWVSILVFYVAYVCSGLYRIHAIALTIAFIGLFLVRVLWSPRSLVALVHGVALCLFGILFETGLAATGAFSHTAVDFLGVPYWLGPLYLHAALCAREIDASTR